MGLVWAKTICLAKEKFNRSKIYYYFFFVVEMVSFFTTRVIYSVIFFVLVSVMVVVSKPRLVFDKETGRAKPFGLGPGKTIFSLGVILCTMSVIVFYTLGIIDMVYACASISSSSSRHRSTTATPPLVTSVPTTTPTSSTSSPLISNPSSAYSVRPPPVPLPLYETTTSVPLYTVSNRK